jgi:hypothetical protein
MLKDEEWPGFEMICHGLQHTSNAGVFARCGLQRKALPQVEKPSLHIREGHVAAVRLATVIRTVILRNSALW